MGQKIHPYGFRLGPLYTWVSRWFADDARYADLLLQDVLLRELLTKRLKPAGLAQVEIERSINKIRVILHVSRPGLVIGRGGTGLEEIKKFIEGALRSIVKEKKLSKASFDNLKTKVEIVVEPVKEPNLSAKILATNIAARWNAVFELEAIQGEKLRAAQLGPLALQRLDAAEAQAKQRLTTIDGELFRQAEQ
ncbi:MAG: KH domain-containing protein, partial [Patescibacteria group bacterium]